VATNDSWIAIVPPYARYPYEIHVVPKAHNSKYAQLDDMALDLLAEVLLECARKLDRLFGFSMPYVMSLHQAPTCGSHPYTWLRFQFTPIYRTADKMKYLAGSESAMGAFINDTLPEETAKRLRQI
jgi:UDPglucose--hexose-1-phosphate uridylyltransferase